MPAPEREHRLAAIREHVDALAAHAHEDFVIGILCITGPLTGRKWVGTVSAILPADPNAHKVVRKAVLEALDKEDTPQGLVS